MEGMTYCQNRWQYDAEKKEKCIQMKPYQTKQKNLKI